MLCTMMVRSLVLSECVYIFGLCCKAWPRKTIEIVTFAVTFYYDFEAYTNYDCNEFRRQKLYTTRVIRETLNKN